MKEKFLITLTETTLNINAYQQFLACEQSGGTVTFLGTVRDFSQGKSVVSLSFEAYESMALKEMEKLAIIASEKWELHKIVIVHAIGKKEIGDAVVFIGTSSKHRAEAFDATRFLIDELKEKVPIWKHEFYNDSSSWLNATP